MPALEGLWPSGWAWERKVSGTRSPQASVDRWHRKTRPLAGRLQQFTGVRQELGSDGQQAATSTEVGDGTKPAPSLRGVRPGCGLGVALCPLHSPGGQCQGCSGLGLMRVH